MSLNFIVSITSPHEVIDANITHNVNKMWIKAGIYDELYKSEGKKVSEVIGKLEVGLTKMIIDSKGYTELNPENGWGSYDGAVKWLTNLIMELKKYPDGIIEIDA